MQKNLGPVQSGTCVGAGVLASRVLYGVEHGGGELNFQSEGRSDNGNKITKSANLFPTPTFQVWAFRFFRSDFSALFLTTQNLDNIL